MVSRTPKTPNREFTIRFKGKSVKFIASSQKEKIKDSKVIIEAWGGHFYCPWFCGHLIQANLKSSPKRVNDALKSLLESHWKIEHRPK